jgi:hypothetical protein
MMARLPGVYPTTQDGGLGIVAPGGEGARVVVGVSSLGTSNLVISLSELSEVPAKLGSGPLARAVADQLAYGGGVVYAVRATGDVAGTITPDAANPANPAVTLTGSALDGYDVVITITRAGALGAGAFTISLDGGDTVSEEISLAASYAIPDTGVTVSFAAGAYVAGNTYNFAITAPKASVSSAQAAIRAALNSGYLYEYVQLAQPADSAMWAALDALALEAENAFQYVFMVAETTPPGADVDAWVTARVTEKASFTSKRVMLIAAHAEVVDTLTGRLEVQSLASRIMARISRNPVQVKAAWVGGGAIAGVIIPAPFTVQGSTKNSSFNNSHSLTLEQAGFTTIYSLIGADGYYVVEDRMAAGSTSDYKITANRRVMDKAVNLVRQAQLKYVQKDVDPVDVNGEIGAIRADSNSALRSMVTDGNIVRGRVVLLPGQDVLSTSKLKFKIRIVPKGYVREIEDDFSFENPFRVA